MARTNKWTVHEGRSESKWFTHNGNFKQDPTKVKKQGFGRNNWGRPGDELEEEYNFFGKTGRRNSNHSENEQVMEDLNDLIESRLYE